MKKIWAKIKAGRDYLIQHNFLALILLLLVVFASWASKNEAAKVKGVAISGAITAGQNTQDIKALKAQVQDVQERPVPPPVVIVQKETKYEKPFTDADMLTRARKLRHEQQSAEKNR